MKREFGNQPEDDRDGMQRFHQRQVSAGAEGGESPSGFDLLVDSGLGDILLGAAVCGLLALGVFIFKRNPVVSSALLTIIALILVGGFVVISTRVHSGPRRTFMIVRDVIIGIALATLILWSIWIFCNCP